MALPVRADAQTRMDGVDGRSSSRQDGARPAIATFEGGTIDLAGDWGQARACLVWREGGVLECFRSSEALAAREAELGARRTASEVTASVAAYAYSCSSSLRLYEHIHYGGRRLSFWDRGFWQNLRDYGFQDRTSSYIVGGCQVFLAEHIDGGGGWYPGPTHAYAGEPSMLSGWNDTLSSIYLR